MEEVQKGKVLSFGEVLLRMSPLVNGGWIAQQQISTFIGGAEGNIAAALTCWDVPCRYVTALPPTYLGDDIVAYLQGRNIDTSFIHRSGDRIGIYYLQQGADLKNAGVIYDRLHSSFYDLKPGMIDWNAALEGVSWLNFSAISPALNKYLPGVCREALEAAAGKGITISVDLNYRAKLWQYGRQPYEIMPGLVQYANVIMGNIWAANTLLGIPLDKHVEDFHSKDEYLEHAQRTSETIVQQFPNCTTVANTFRFEQGEAGLEYYTTLYRDNRQFVSPHFVADAVTDKIGSGDCFMAGLIYGLYNQHSPQAIIDFAAAAAFGKINETGDATSQSIAQVHAILHQQYAKQ